MQEAAAAGRDGVGWDGWHGDYQRCSLYVVLKCFASIFFSKIARRNINNLRYAEDTTLMAESEEELKSLLMKVKEESKNLA